MTRIAAQLALAIALISPSLPVSAGEALDWLGPWRMDSEAEAEVRLLATPLLQAAGYPIAPLHVKILTKGSYNVFMPNPQTIYVDAIMLMEAEEAEQLTGAIAHEIGHLKAGHLSNLRKSVERAKASQAIAVINGFLPASTIGSSETFAYTEAEEDEANKTAVDLLEASGYSPAGLRWALETIEGSDWSIASGSAMKRIHPVDAEMVAKMTALEESSPHRDVALPEDIKFRRQMAQARMYAFLKMDIDAVRRKYPLSDTSPAADYARAVIDARNSRTRPARTMLDSLAERFPDHIYFKELRGQLDAFSLDEAENAITPLYEVTGVDPEAGPALLALGHVLLKYRSDDAELLAFAHACLSDGLIDHPEATYYYDDLVAAAEKLGDPSLVIAANARKAFGSGQFDLANRLALQALPMLMNDDGSYRSITRIIELTTR